MFLKPSTFVTPALGRSRQEGPWVSLTNLAYSANSRPVRYPISRKQNEWYWEMPTKGDFWPPHTHTGTSPPIHIHTQENLQCLEDPQRRAFSNSDILAKTRPLRWTWTSILLLFGLFFSTGIEPRASLCHWVHSYPATQPYQVAFQFRRNHKCPEPSESTVVIPFLQTLQKACSLEREIQVT